MKKCLLILSLLFWVIPKAIADDRTEQQMRESAAKVLNSSNRRTAGNCELKELKSLPKLKIYGYDEGGFAVVTTDDRFDEVIGYSLSRYNDSVPCGFGWWIETVNNNMTSANRTDHVANTRQSNRAYSAVSPLITSIWGQDRPFNDDCIITNNNKTYQCVTGCVATALAQVMNYYKYPKCGTGSNSYNITYNNDFTFTFFVDFSQSVYDWDNMLDNYKSYQNTSTKDSHTKAVAKLMWDCGVATTTNFSDATHGSSSSLQRVGNALKTYFCYDESTNYYSRSDYGKDEWMDMVYNELDHARPVLYCGAESNSLNSVGHAFVLNGYDSSGKVYINWGWNGYCDGYFDIDLMNPNNENYNYRQAMVIAKPGNNSATPQLQTLKISAKGSGTVYYGGMEGIQVRGENISFKVKEGSDAVLLLSPDLGSSIKSVKINNNDVTSNVKDNSYTIDNIKSSTDVEVEFDVSSDVSSEEYNVYITCTNTSSSTTIIGSSVTKTIGFEIMNSGNSTIYINKLIAKVPETNEVILNSTDASVLGELKGGCKKTLSFKTTKDVLPTYEMEYTLNNKRYVYYMSKYKVLILTSNNFGHILYSNISVGSDSRKFSVEPGKSVIFQLIPNEGCNFKKLMVGSSDVTSQVTNNNYTISNFSSNTSVTATFETSNSINGYEYVDLGLPSGKYWSTMNYGANKPEEYGSYFNNLNRASSTISSKWGKEWIIPTKEDYQELIDKCQWTWTELNGVTGFIIKGTNGNTMFLPAAGKDDGFGSLGTSGAGTTAYYLTSSETDYGIYNTWILKGNSSDYKLVTTHIVIEGYPVRPISTIYKEPTIYTLSIKTKGGGSVVYNGTTIRDKTSTFETKEGSDIVISFEPDNNNIIKVLKENGKDMLSKMSNNQYVINSISKSTEIEVEFEYVAPTLYSLTYMVDGNVYKKYELEKGSSITPEPEPTKAGYTFSGWSEIPVTMPAHDVIVTGSFKRIYNVGDVTNVVNFIMNDNAGTADLAQYDLNNDGELNIGDIILIVKWILNNTSNSRNAVRKRTGEIVDLRQYTAAQFEIRIPKNVKVKDIHLVNSMKQSHQIMYQKLDEQTYAVVIYSLTNQLIIPDQNNIIEIDAEGTGSENVKIQNAILAKPNGEIANYEGFFVSTGIEQSVYKNEKTAVIYDLKGNRLDNGNSQKKGVYIINGNKVVVK